MYFSFSISLRSDEVDCRNLIIAHEIMHTMRKNKGQGQLMGVKLDMSKAYDRLEWSFLSKFLQALA